MPSQRSIFFKIGLLLLSIIFSMFALEVFVRLIAPQELVRAYLPNETNPPYLFKPNFIYHDRYSLPLFEYSVRTNNFGLRMNQNVMLSGNIRHLIAIGDSFTFGWGVEIEQSFFDRIRIVVEKSNSSVQMLNFGVGAASTGHAFHYLKRLLPRTHPCGVVYFLNPNDLIDNLNTDPNYRVTDYIEVDNGRIILTDKLRFTPTLRFLRNYTFYGRLNQSSHLFIMIKRGTKVLLSRKADNRENPSVGLNLGFISKLSNSGMETLSINVTEAHIERLVNFTRSKSVPLFVAWIPAWTELFERENLANRLFYNLKSKLARSKLFFFHDPLHAMKGMIRNKYSLKEIFFPDGEPVGHFTVLGNALYSDAVTGEIVKFTKSACSKVTGFYEKEK